MLLFCDSFNTAPLAKKWDVLGGTITSGAGRFDSAGLRLGNNNDLLAKTFSATYVPTLYAGFAMQLQVAYSSSFVFCAFYDTTNPLAVGTIQVALALTTAGAIEARRGTTVLGTSAAGVFTLNTWAYIELGTTIDPSAGVLTVKVNGIQVLNLTGQNTRNTSNTGANQFALQAPQPIWGGNFYFDDLYLCNSSGSFNNTFLGDIKVVGSGPTANGTATAWTQNIAARANSTAYALGVTILDSNSNLQRVTTAGTSGGSAPTWATTLNATTTDSSVTWTNLGTQAAYKLVNETTADEDSSYLSDATVNDQSRFTFPGTTGSVVKAVMVYARARKDDAGARSIRTVAKSGATTGDNGSDLALSASYQTFAGLFETDPATSAAWTVAAVNGAEFGVKTTV